MSERSCFCAQCRPPTRNPAGCLNPGRTGGIGRAVQVPARSGDGVRTKVPGGAWISEHVADLAQHVTEGKLVACFGRSDDEPFFIVKVTKEVRPASRPLVIDTRISPPIRAKKGDRVFYGLKLEPIAPGSCTFELDRKDDGKTLQPAVPVRLDEARVAPIKMARGTAVARLLGGAASAAAAAAAPLVNVFTLGADSKHDILHFCCMFDASLGEGSNPSP